MSTINISVPKKLKENAEKLVEGGYYSSFSDVVRAGLRDVLQEHHYSEMLADAKTEYLSGKTKSIKSKKELKEYFKNLQD